MDEGIIPTIKIGNSRRINVSKATDFIRKTTAFAPAEGGANVMKSLTILKPLKSIGKINSGKSANGKVKWYLSRFPLRYDNSGKIIYAESGSFTSKAAVKHYRDQCIKRREELSKISPDNPLVCDDFKEWLKDTRESHWENDMTKNLFDSWIEKQFRPVFGDTGVKDCNKKNLRRFFNEQAKDREVKKFMGALKEYFADLFDEETIERNPMRKMKIPEHTAIVSQEEMREPLTADEESKLFNYLVNSKDKRIIKYRHGIMLMMCTGARPAEICGSEWENINWGSKTKSPSLYIKKSNPKNGTISKVKNGTKNKWGKRYVPFSKDIIVYLKEARDKKSSDWIMESPTKRNKPLGTDTFCRTIQRAAKNAGLGRKICAYTLRHTFATNASLILPLPYLAYLMGHKDPRMLEEIYANHVNKDIIDRYKEPLQNILNITIPTSDDED